MTEELRKPLCEHALGNHRVMMTIAGELLLSAAKQELPQLDEKLFLQNYPSPQTTAKRRAAANR